MTSSSASAIAVAFKNARHQKTAVIRVIGSSRPMVSPVNASRATSTCPATGMAATASGGSGIGTKPAAAITLTASITVVRA